MGGFCFGVKIMKKKFHRALRAALRPLLAALAFAVIAAAPAAADEATPPLVGVGWLNSHLHDAHQVVLDVRSVIDGGGTKAYLAAHIPGSVHTDYDKGGWRVTRHNVPFMLPGVPELEALIGNLGIDEGTRVIVVPAGVSFTDFGSAARVYWTLKVAGLKNVSILDGGVAAWKAAGLPFDSGAHQPSATIFNVKLDNSLLATVSDVQKIETAHNATLIDARPAAFFLGKVKAPGAKAYGHIPGAVNLSNADFYDAKTNRLKPKAELAKLAASVPTDKPAVSYCNTGHWAATDWFVLHEVLGRKNVALYDGSMVEWTADAHRPIASARTKWDDLKKALGLGS